MAMKPSSRVRVTARGAYSAATSQPEVKLQHPSNGLQPAPGQKTTPNRVRMETGQALLLGFSGRHVGLDGIRPSHGKDSGDQAARWINNSGE
jgi:hypothetical protein